MNQNKIVAKSLSDADFPLSSILRESDISGLESIGKDRHFGTVYYPGSYIDLAPVIVLNSDRYYYQDRHSIVGLIHYGLSTLQNTGILEMKELSYRKSDRYAEFVLRANNHTKRLHVLECSDVEKELPSEIIEADLVYGYNSLITEA